MSLPLYAPYASPSFSGQIRTESAPNVDFSLNKATRITEHTNLQFRAEVFNLTNTFSFSAAQPNSTLTSSSFGTVVPANVSSGFRYCPAVHFSCRLKYNF